MIGLSMANTFRKISDLERGLRAQRQCASELLWEGGMGTVGQGFLEFAAQWKRELKPLPPIYTQADYKKWRLPWTPGGQIFGVVCGYACRYCGNRTTEVSRNQCKTCAGDLKCPNSTTPPPFPPSCLSTMVLGGVDPDLSGILTPLTTKPLKVFGFSTVTSQSLRTRSERSTPTPSRGSTTSRVR